MGDVVYLADRRPDLAVVVAAGETVPAVELASWATGYCAGWDTAAAAAGERVRVELAETVAELDRTSYLPHGRVTRLRRLSAETEAAARRAVPVQQSDGWPEVTVPGTGILATVRDTHPCRCPRQPSRCRPSCPVDHATAGPGHHWVGYDADGRWSDPHRPEPTGAQLAASARVLGRWTP